MAIPKIFVSSTHYDLTHVRNDIEIFIQDLGYDPVLFERDKIAYNQLDTLEDSCYREIENCEILVCIIGNKYGTESNSSNYSITMKELQTAVKQQKKCMFLFKKMFSLKIILIERIWIPLILNPQLLMILVYMNLLLNLKKR